MTDLNTNLKKAHMPLFTPSTASSNFGCPQNFFIQLFPNWTACSPITYTNLVLQTVQFTSSDFTRKTIVKTILLHIKRLNCLINKISGYGYC